MEMFLLAQNLSLTNISAPGTVMGVLVALASGNCVHYLGVKNFITDKMNGKTYQRKVSTMDKWQVVKRNIEFLVGSSH